MTRIDDKEGFRLALSPEQLMEILSNPEAISQHFQADQFPTVEEQSGGGHTLDRHVGKTEASLRARLDAEPKRPAASSFATLEPAESPISKIMHANAKKTLSMGSAVNWLNASGINW